MTMGRMACNANIFVTEIVSAASPIPWTMSVQSTRYARSLHFLVAELTCALCGELYNSPVSLPCTHVFCSGCVRGKLEGVGVYKSECPSCHSPAFVRDLRSNTKVQAVALIAKYLLQRQRATPVSAGLAQRPAQPVEPDELDGLPGAAVDVSPEAAPPRTLAGLCEDLQQWASDLDAQPHGGEGLHGEALDACAVQLQDALEELIARLGERGIVINLRDSDATLEESDPEAHGVGDSQLAEAASLLAHLRPAQLRAVCRQFWPHVRVSTWSLSKVRRALSRVELDSLKAACCSLNQP